MVLLAKSRLTLFPIFHSVTPSNLSQSWGTQDLSAITNLEFVCPLRLEENQWEKTCEFILKEFPNLRKVLVTVVVYLLSWYINSFWPLLIVATPFKGVKDLRTMVRPSLELNR